MSSGRIALDDPWPVMVFPVADGVRGDLAAIKLLEEESTADGVWGNTFADHPMFLWIFEQELSANEME